MYDYLIQMSSEEKLLISLCRLEFSREQRTEIRDQVETIRDWDYFVRMANEHGIIALCWYNIQETGNSQYIPAEQLDIMHKGYLTSLARNALLFDHLKHIITLAEEENIKVVLLKGLALERTVYGNKGLRQMNDIDILVKKDSAIKLRKKLLKNGFESIPIISPLHEKILPAYGKHLPEMYKNGLSVEIHFKLFDQKGNSLTEKVFDRSLLFTSDFNDCEVYIPEPQLFFLYLVKHLDKHEKTGTSQLRLYIDLIVLLSRFQQKIINERLIELARNAGLQEILTEKLFIIKLFWDFGFPIWIEGRFNKFDKDKILNRFLNFLHQPKDNQPEEDPDSLLKPLSDISGFFNKALFIFGYLIPSLTFMKFRYKANNVAVALFYYPVRWVKLVKLLFEENLR